MNSSTKTRALLGQLGDMDLRLLRVFRVVAECGGISAAELELNIGRSTISRHIKDLEIRLGVTLCRRGRSGFSLTEEGKTIYQATLRLLGSMELFRSEVNDLHREMKGSLSVAMLDKTAANPQANIHGALAAFDQIAPEVSLHVYVEPINEIERGLMEGRFQIGIVPAHRQSSSIDYYPLFGEQMYLYCGAAHPLFELEAEALTEEQVRRCKYVGLGYHSPNMETGRQQSLERQATVYDQEAIVHFLLSGRYLGYLPEHYARPFVEQGNIRALWPERFQYQCDFQAIVRHAPKPSRIVQTFLDSLIKVHLK